MTLRTWATRAAVGIAAVAGANAALARRAGELEAPLPGDERTYRWRGMDVAYTEAGDPDDPAVVLLHGIHAAATSYEWAPIAGDLAATRRVVAPDLPGFGRSERPPIDYDADRYVDFVCEFVADVAPGAACVASSLTGSYAALAQRASGPFSRLVLVCPTATTTTARRPRLRSLVYAPVVGEALFNLLSSEPSIRYFDADHGYYDPRRIPDDEVDYQWRSAHQPGARFAPAAFVSGYLDPDVDLADALSELEVPITLVWGREADLTPLAYGRDLARAADARLVAFDRAKLLVHVEHAGRFLELLEGELSRAED